jgi:glycosyltransferase involved in cell wall biosynthesis
LDLRLDAAARIELMGKMARRGHEVSFLVLRSKEKFQNTEPNLNLIELPIRVCSILSSIVFLLYIFFFLPIQLLYSRPDVVFLESELFSPSFITSVVYSKLRRIKVILDVRSPPVETTGLRGYLQVTSFNISIFFARGLFDGITTLTPMMAEEIRRKFRINSEFFTSWSSGVSIDLFTPKKQFSGFNLKKELGIDEKSFVVLYHGSISENRGVLEIVEAMSELQAKNLGIFLLIFGSGSAFDAVRLLIEKKRLGKNILLLNKVSYVKVPYYIAVSDVCIIPLPDHPFWRAQNPLKLLEYLSMEKVVIVTDIPAHRSVIGDCKCGIFMPSNEPDEIAKSIIFAYESRNHLREWGIQGRRIVEKRYTWEAIAQKLEEYLKGFN